MPYRIEIKDVSFAYDGQAPLFKGVSLAVEPGEVLLIVADVGSGKSTLLKICAGLIEPLHGTVRIDGKDVWTISEDERNEIRRNMGFDFQEGALIANMTISQNLSLPLRYHGGLTIAEIDKRVEGWISKVGLTNYANLLPAALSMGLRRRASFARAMICGRDALFWDSPAQVVDDDYQQLLGSTIGGLKSKGVSSIITAGDAGYMSAVVDRRFEI